MVLISLALISCARGSSTGLQKVEKMCVGLPECEQGAARKGGARVWYVPPDEREPVLLLLDVDKDFLCVHHFVRVR